MHVSSTEQKHLGRSLRSALLQDFECSAQPIMAIPETCPTRPQLRLAAAVQSKLQKLRLYMLFLKTPLMLPRKASTGRDTDPLLRAHACQSATSTMYNHRVFKHARCLPCGCCWNTRLKIAAPSQGLHVQHHLPAGPRVIVPALDLKRLAEAEAMLARFSRENEWLALQVRCSLPHNHLILF